MREILYILFLPKNCPTVRKTGTFNSCPSGVKIISGGINSI